MVAFNKTRKFANIFNKVNCWGASVVMVGALFKIQHYPGASVMLMVGLLAEAAIFFVTGLSPVPTEYHWQNIFPELMFTEEDEDAAAKSGETLPICTVEPLAGEIDKTNSGYQLFYSGEVATSKKAGSTGDALAAFDNMLEKAGGANFFDKLQNNFANFNENVKDLSSVSSAAAASKSFTDMH